MSLRFLRTLVLAVGACVVTFVIVSPGAAAPGRANAQSRGQSASARCVTELFGLARTPARPLARSAGPQVVARFALFRRTRSAADALPAAAMLGRGLAAAGAVSYDPSAAVRVARTGGHGAVYAVPAMITLPPVSAACRAHLGAAGVANYLAYQNLVTGSGPGACLVSIALVSPDLGPGVPLPGAPRPRRRLTVVDAGCQSETVLSEYAGSLGMSTASETQRALVPDGVRHIAYTSADGRKVTAPVMGNLAVVPPDLTRHVDLSHPTAAKLRRLLAGRLPTSVTENGAGDSPRAVLTRPAALVSDAVNAILFEVRVLKAGLTFENSSSSGFGASCRARSHRCVAVTVTTVCSSSDRCRTSRTIYHYRYVTSKPPARTTGPDTQPTAPTVGRTNRFVTRPKKLALVLGGAPHRRVDVLLSVACFTSHMATGEPVSQVQEAVPSRTPIALPGAARTFKACDVGALVLSRQGGVVHVRVARG